MPLYYEGGVVDEHLKCREDAVWFDVSHLGTVRVEGSDAFNSLQRAFSNDLEKIEPGRAQYSHLLANDGSVLDDVIIWWINDDLFEVLPNASNTDNVQEAIGGLNITATRALIAIQGPNARSYIEKINATAANVKHFGVWEFQFEGANCLAAGTGYTGEDGVECSVPINLAQNFVNELIDTGVTPAGLGARDTLRLEAGLPLYGHELGADITPLQANLSWVVGWGKSNFIGKDALLEEKANGVSRCLYGLITDTRQPLREDCVVYSGNHEIGKTTSGNFSPVLSKGIALAFLPPRMNIGDAVEIDVRGRRVAASVTKLPFVRKAY